MSKWGLIIAPKTQWYTFIYQDLSAAHITRTCTSLTHQNALLQILRALEIISVHHTYFDVCTRIYNGCQLRSRHEQTRIQLISFSLVTDKNRNKYEATKKTNTIALIIDK